MHSAHQLDAQMCPHSALCKSMATKHSSTHEGPGPYLLARDRLASRPLLHVTTASLPSQECHWNKGTVQKLKNINFTSINAYKAYIEDMPHPQVVLNTMLVKIQEYAVYYTF